MHPSAALGRIQPSPTLAVTTRVLELKRAGVDIIELGIPFSDPLADGPVNQAAAMRALEAGATLPRVIEIVRRIRAKSQVP